MREGIGLETQADPAAGVCGLLIVNSMGAIGGVEHVVHHGEVHELLAYQVQGFPVVGWIEFRFGGLFAAGEAEENGAGEETLDCRSLHGDPS